MNLYQVTVMEPKRKGARNRTGASYFVMAETPRKASAEVLAHWDYPMLSDLYVRMVDMGGTGTRVYEPSNQKAIQKVAEASFKRSEFPEPKDV